MKYLKKVGIITLIYLTVVMQTTYVYAQSYNDLSVEEIIPCNFTKIVPIQYDENICIRASYTDGEPIYYTTDGSIIENVDKYLGLNDIACSDWAKADITTAIEAELVPKALQNNYTKPITREEFCTITVNMLHKLDDKIVESNGNNIHYDDTSKDEVISASSLGIVSGIGNNKFNPDGNITRQEAARMLYMTSTIGERYNELKGCFSEKVDKMNSTVIMPHIFRDGYKIQNWAQESVNYCYMYGIMQGSNNNLFDVGGTYSREQAIVTILRFYNLYKDGNLSVPSRDYLYAKSIVKDGIEAWGYINEKNKWIIEPDFENPIYTANPFEGNYAIIDLGFASGLRMINKKGDIVHTGFNHGVRFGDIVSFENDNGTTNLNTGEVIGEPIFNLNKLISGAGETLIPIRDTETGLYGYYNSEGRLIIPKKYEEAYIFCNGNAIVKENNKYKLIDHFGTAASDFSPALNKGEYIDYAVGNLYVVKKDDEYEGQFCSIGRVDKGTILKSGDDAAFASLLTSGDIYAEDNSNKYKIYNNNGKLVFTNNIPDINYDNISDIYCAVAYVDNDVRYDRIITRQGNEIVTADSDKYGIIGNGTFYVFNDNIITVYDNKGNIISTINTTYSISEAYSDNGVIFVIDKNGNFNGYTYIGKKVI